MKIKNGLFEHEGIAWDREQMTNYKEPRYVDVVSELPISIDVGSV